ncbi:MAG: putative immunity protein [Aristaeellaceae bacterium]
MPRLRRMPGSAEHPTVAAMMRLMETQSHATLTRWAADQAEALALPVYLAACPEDGRLPETLAAVRRFLAGELSAAGLAAPLEAARQAARETADPAAQAAARASTSALGFTFCCAAAVACAQAGTSASPAGHDALADEVFARLLTSLRAAAIPGEARPARLNWGY